MKLITLAFSKGSLILIDYTTKIKDTEEIVDTTSSEVAEENNIYEEKSYKPQLVSVNDISYPALPGLNEALVEASVGDKLVVEVPPEKGFGKRDSNKIRMIPVRKLGDDAEKISVGDVIEVDGKKGSIRFIGSGRVQIDYNHKYAGKTILHDVTIVKSLETSGDKVDGILNHYVPVDNDIIWYDFVDNDLEIYVKDDVEIIDKLQENKSRIQSDLFQFVPTMKSFTLSYVFFNRDAEPDYAEVQEPMYYDTSDDYYTEDVVDDDPNNDYRRLILADLTKQLDS